jgi:hypothetical protein
MYSSLVVFGPALCSETRDTSQLEIILIDISYFSVYLITLASGQNDGEYELERILKEVIVECCGGINHQIFHDTGVERV